jgi:two-component system phosphate regulon sensor histidine kinase PhoR
MLLAGVFVGWLYGRPAIGLLVATLAVLGWHLWCAYRFENWLHSGMQGAIPGGSGFWPQLFARFRHLDERASRYRKRWRGLVRELRASAKAFPEGVVVLNGRREIIQYNRVARQHLGLRKRRDSGQRIESFVRHPEFLSFLEAGDADASVTIPSPTDSGVWLECRLVPYGSRDRLLLLRDTSTEHRVEAMRRDFVANASHELRSPLTVLAGYLDTMGDDQAMPAEWHQPIGDMQRQVERMTRLVADLLELSRLENAGHAATTDEVALQSIVHTVVDEAGSVYSGQMNITVDVPASAILLGDEADIYSVVQNLVSNAIRFTPDGGSIQVAWQIDAHAGRLIVSDDGPGIPAEAVPRLTERFFRVDDGRARDDGGTGLGLAIVRHALDRHEARLEIDSVPGQGSTFTCDFPMARLAGTAGAIPDSDKETIT